MSEDRTQGTGQGRQEAQAHRQRVGRGAARPGGRHACRPPTRKSPASPRPPTTPARPGPRPTPAWHKRHIRTGDTAPERKAAMERSPGSPAAAPPGRPTSSSTSTRRNASAAAAASRSARATCSTLIERGEDEEMDEDDWDDDNTMVMSMANAARLHRLRRLRPRLSQRLPYPRPPAGMTSPAPAVPAWTLPAGTRLLFFHKQRTSARLRFLLFAEGLVVPASLAADASFLRPLKRRGPSSSIPRCWRRRVNGSSIWRGEKSR